MKYLAFLVGLSATYLLLVSFNRKPLARNGVGVARYLMGLGYNKAHASGIAGNIFVESSYNPQAIGDSGKSFGLAQWHKSRWESLNSWTIKKGMNPNTMKAQLDFLVWELNNTEKRANRELLKTDNPRDSAFAFAKYFERPSVISEIRMEKAVSIYNKL